MLKQIISENFQQQIKDLGDLIAIASVSRGVPEEGKPLGAELDRALHFVLDTARKLGFEDARSLDGYCGVVDYGEGAEQLLIMTHLDVVPAGTGWTGDPFTLREENGRLIGRGVLDDKGAAVAALYALYAVKEDGLATKRRVRLLFGLDEERGWSCIDRYKKTEVEPDMAFTPDGSFPVVNSEMSIYHCTYHKPLTGSGVEIDCGTAANVIPGEARAKLLFDTVPVDAAPNGVVLSGAGNVLTATGSGGHAAHPEDAHNALLALLYALTEQPLCEEDLLTAESLFALLAFDLHGEGFAIDCADASGRLTLSPDILKWDRDGVSITLDCRYPVCMTEERLKAAMDHAFSAIGFECVHTHNSCGHYVDPNSELVETLLEVYSDATGKKAKPLSIGGGTYARSFKNAVAFGVDPEGAVSQCHMPDESISVEEFRFNTAVIGEAIRRLACK